MLPNSFHTRILFGRTILLKGYLSIHKVIISQINEHLSYS